LNAANRIIYRYNIRNVKLRPKKKERKKLEKKMKIMQFEKKNLG